MTGPRDLGRVLVTGAAGFLGAALVRRLRGMGQVVTASDLGTQDYPCDLTDFAQVDWLVGQQRFQTIFHCGAVSGPMVLADQPLAIWQINALGTAHVLEAARRHAVARVVVCSTCDVYGDLTGTVDETTLLHPVTVYGASKVAAEAAMLGFVREHALDAVALRLAWLYGPGRQTPTSLAAMIRAAAVGADLSVDAGPDDITHYLYIEDAVSGLVCAGQAAVLRERVYNISAGRGIPMWDVVATLRDLELNAAISLSPTAAPAGPWVLDNRRALQDLGFSPATSLADGLRLYRDALAQQDGV